MSLTCKVCNRESETTKSLLMHMSRSHRSDFLPLDERYAFLPWHNIEVVDRGFLSQCWQLEHIALGSGMTNRYARRIVLERDGVVCSRVGLLAIHLCEVADVENRCVRPDHIVVGTRSENNFQAWRNPRRRRAASSLATGVKRGPYKVQSDRSNDVEGQT